MCRCLLATEPAPVPSLHEHAIAIREKPILLIDGMTVSLEHALASCKCRYQNEQGRARQMKIREQRTNYSEPESRINKDAGLSITIANPSRFERGMFQGPHDGCPYGDHSAFLVQGAIDRTCCFRANAVGLDVQSVRFHVIFAQRLKCSQPHVQGDFGGLDSKSPDLIEDLRREM